MIQTNQNYIFYFKSTTTNNSFRALAPQNHFNQNEIIKLKDEHYKLITSFPISEKGALKERIETAIDEEIKIAMDNGRYDGYEMITVSIHIFDDIMNILEKFMNNENFLEFRR